MILDATRIATRHASHSSAGTSEVPSTEYDTSSARSTRTSTSSVTLATRARTASARARTEA